MRLRIESDYERLAFTKVELFVVVSIVSILMGLLIPAVNRSRGPSRANQCATQINGLSKAAIQYDINKKHFPGYVNDFGSFIGTTDPSDPESHVGDCRSGDKKLGSWVVTLMPYLDAQATYEIWTKDNYPVLVRRNGDLSFTESAAPNLSIMQCPRSPTLVSSHGRNSYIANTGMHHLNSARLPIVVARTDAVDEQTMPTTISFLDSMQVANGVFNNFLMCNISSSTTLSSSAFIDSKVIVWSENNIKC